MIHDFNHGPQALAGMGLFHQLFNQKDAGKYHPLAGAGHVRKQTVLNRVVLGAVGRVVSNADFDPQLINQFLEVFFEDEVAGVITATAVTQSQDSRRLRISHSPVLKPPSADAIADELAGVLAGT